MRMTGHTILITGGTRGIGRGLAEAFHRLGNQVIVTGRSRAQVQSATAGRPGFAGALLDLDDRASLPALAADLRDRFPDLDMLVANAGISGSEDLTADDWDPGFAEHLIDTNIVGVLRTVAAFLPQLRRQRQATLMVTGSKLAFLPLAAFPTYCATKAFLHSWLQSLRHQFRHEPLEVLELLPPYVATALTGEAQRTDARAMPLDAFIAEVMMLLEAGDHPNGEILVERARGDRHAEREGRYESAFAAVNPL